MKSDFVNYIKTHKLLNYNDKVLLAVSGGIDSMVMLDLFLKTTYNISVAHCNFHLRGEESDGDQQLVVDCCINKGIRCYTIDFDTLEYSKEQGVSIQMAARELRYNWFRELLNTEGFSKLAIAHNADDQTETFFINLLRGTGLEGLTGMEIKDHHIIRPIMFASREDIEKYSIEFKVPFREDSSNSSIKYARNKIRHQIIPAFESIRPGFKKRLLNNMNFLASANDFIKTKISEIESKAVKRKGDVIEIYFEYLIQEPSFQFILFNLLQSYGFKGDVIEQIAASIQAPSGKIFISDMYSLVKDREKFVISPRILTQETYYIEEKETFINTPIKLYSRILFYDSSFKLNLNSSIAQLDADLLHFPLELRRWRPGDSFVPLGMKNKKKLSDFFIDLKIPLNEKQSQWVLVSGEDIVWIIGFRIDDRYKITSTTKEILFLEVQDTVLKDLNSKNIIPKED